MIILKGFLLFLIIVIGVTIVGIIGILGAFIIAQIIWSKG